MTDTPQVLLARQTIDADLEIASKRPEAITVLVETFHLVSGGRNKCSTISYRQTDPASSPRSGTFDEDQKGNIGKVRTLFGKNLLATKNEC